MCTAAAAPRSGVLSICRDPTRDSHFLGLSTETGPGSGSHVLPRPEPVGVGHSRSVRRREAPAAGQGSTDVPGGDARRPPRFVWRTRPAGQPRRKHAPRPRQRTPPRAGQGSGRGRVAGGRRGADKGAPPTTPGPASAAGPPSRTAPCARGAVRGAGSSRARLLRETGTQHGGPSGICCSGETAALWTRPPESWVLPRSHCRELTAGARGPARSAGDRGESSGRSRSREARMRAAERGSPHPELGLSGCPSRALLAGAEGPPRRWGSGCSAMLGAPGPSGAARGPRRRAHGWAQTEARSAAGGAEAGRGQARLIQPRGADLPAGAAARSRAVATPSLLPGQGTQRRVRCGPDSSRLREYGCPYAVYRGGN